MTHPTIALQEEVTALLVLIGVWGFENHLQDELPRNKTIHLFLFVYLIWTVAVEEFMYRLTLLCTGLPLL